ncbi:MAG: hypothetical protein Q9201_006675, partial [Fulgogasparrea decipioides]
ISDNGTLSDLDSVAGVCRSWRIAALPYLFYSVQIDLSLDQKEQLQHLHSSLLNEHSPCRPFVRELRVQGNQHELLDRYLDLLVNAITSLHRLTHFSYVKQHALVITSTILNPYPDGVSRAIYPLSF